MIRQRQDHMKIDIDVKTEAIRLYTKYGDLAESVAEEIELYDNDDLFFWDDVIYVLQNIEQYLDK